jgi:uroporphyrinogen decarboxylase
MPKETLTPKERWLAVITHQKPDRVPLDYWATPEVTQKLMKFLNCSSFGELAERFHLDYVVGVSPAYIGPPIPPGEDMYGCKYKEVNYGTGVYSECIYHPLAKYDSVEEIERNYIWPSVDWFDYSVIPKQIEGKENYPISGGGSEPFLAYKDLRGQEQAFMDLILNPEIVHYCLDKLFDFCYQNTLRIYETIPGKVLFSYVAEDLGAQEDLMYSPEHIRTFLLPRMKRMMDLAHQAGAFVFHHSDGAIRRILPDMVSAGIDILNPIQWRCKGMDRRDLKKEFGDKIAFHGAMDNQQTLPFGSEEDVRKEVRENIDILGEGGGYILAPCHNLQPVTPMENIVAMYEEAYNYGWY